MAEQLAMTLPAVVEGAAVEGGMVPSHAEALRDAVGAGIEVSRRICERVIARDNQVPPGQEAAIDVSLLRLGSTTGLGLVRIGVRVAEGEYRAKRDGALAALLQELANQPQPAVEAAERPKRKARKPAE